MVDKNNPDLASLPTKAIVVYNGTDKWDPFKKYKNIRAKFKGRVPNFEFAFVNLADIDDSLCLADTNAEAAIGIITMKYAFDAKKYQSMLPKIEDRLRTLSFSECTTLIGKIELYLGEYVNEKTLRRLKMAFQSIGKKLGFVSAGDVRRALERKVRRMESTNKAKDAKLAEQDQTIAEQAAELSEKDALIATLRAENARLKAAK